MSNNDSFNGLKVEINYHTSNPAFQELLLFATYTLLAKSRPIASQG